MNKIGSKIYSTTVSWFKEWLSKLDSCSTCLLTKKDTAGIVLPSQKQGELPSNMNGTI